MRHSVVACFALIKVRPELGDLSRNTILFRVFQILHNSATIQFILA